MKLFTFKAPSSSGNGVHVGALDATGSTAVSFTRASRGDARFASMLALVRAGSAILDEAQSILDSHPADAAYDLAEVTLLAPLPDPPRFRDCSLFIEHLAPAFLGMARTLAAAAEDPDAEYERLVATGDFGRPAVFAERVIYYNADHLSVSGPGDEIVAPPDTHHVDYELEIAAVVGTTGRNLTAADAGAAIFGYTIFNDWSCRDLQTEVMASRLGPARGKDFDGANTVGPWIVTADELGDPYQLKMSARVNGETWSDGSSASIEHTFEDAVAYLSRGRTIHAGELLGSGTVLSGSPIEIGKRLKDGDEVELEVEGIGVLRNRLRLSR
ncbi:2-keto-4-pentenoate hydratase/2-oxohepta-3-ene-1,7-dioic acid hydratase (catechol pathway) [Nocardioides terrae]|uniref:2-keto-4-pentenoate hydratase/2-oxohepta-3-ene-1,7-dioic acid hydratase (Catechol pathway) n=1 Tax=Nocardioides terrae TaxID=574651 RepID=A0A1I1F3E6_9ACTN|nr:fumarylacetoacetate hydrolase family protein [Nocardioides terrae]SFB93462.1 2-keto-4-pentenoate hydratase/2-oxohepta-3-ene-1,7-dioic acid hydratase (catechol pathway) [Nocardioides terrae]